MARIIFTGGGTAGHVTPNQVLIPPLQKEGHDIHYIGTKGSIEERLISAMPGVTFHAVHSGKLRRYFDMRNFTDPFKVVYGATEAFSLIRKLRPALVFSKGGFVSVPVVYAAALRGVAVICHESDLTPGLANKLSTPHAKKVLTTFPETAAHFGPKGVHVGTPLRPELLQGSAAKGLALCGFDASRPTILFIGGSSGAMAINAALREALPLLTTQMNIIHLCGKDRVDAALEGVRGYKQFEYLTDDLPDIFACARMVVSRAGSGAIQELLLLKKPMLLIPYPKGASRGDQIENARSFEARGLCRVLDQSQLNAATLTQNIQAVLSATPDLMRAMAAQPSPDGTERTLAHIRQYL